MHIARGELALSQFKFVLHHEIGSDSERKKNIFPSFHRISHCRALQKRHLGIKYKNPKRNIRFVKDHNLVYEYVHNELRILQRSFA